MELIINNYTSTSTITLGGFDTSIVANELSFSWANLIDDFFWSLEIKSAAYGTETLNLTAKNGILDTGTSMIIFETDDFNMIWEKIIVNRTWGTSLTTGLRACYCDSIADFSDITLNLGGVITTLSTKTYIDFINNSVGQDVCEFWIDYVSTSLGDPFVLLGDSFLREYYIYHDVSNKKVGFYRNFGQDVNRGCYPFSVFSALPVVVIIALDL